MADMTAKKAPGFLKNSVIYQINLRAFTPGGTLKSAEEMLPHIASLGVDLVYLCPIFLADDDPREEFWSERQRQSGFGNPQNMYRMKDYYSIDPEYGTDDDLKSFVRTAHDNNLRVLLDLVPGHTAIDHPWFRESAKGTRNACTDRYIWSNPGTQDANSPYESIRGFLCGISERPERAAINCFATQPCLNYGFGTVTEDMPGKVLLKTLIGGRRILAKLTGMQLPRIC